MLLVVDVGNTNISLGVFDQLGNDGSRGYSPKATWRVSTDSEKTVDEYGLMLYDLLRTKSINSEDISHAAMCSAVPPITPILEDAINRYFNIKPLVVGSGVKTGIKVLYDSPRDVGTDRIADAAAALELYGGPIIVVDFGTATVFDAISVDGEYLGGAIAPGINVGADALFLRTSQLRKVELLAPRSAIGKNTIQSLQSGLVLGYAEMVKGMVSRFDKELGGGSKVIATGGLAKLIETEAPIFDTINENLTLVGLNIIYKLNS